MAYSLKAVERYLANPKYSVSEVGIRHGSMIYFLFGVISKRGRKHVNSGEAELDVGGREWEMRSSDGGTISHSETVDRAEVEGVVSPNIIGATITSMVLDGSEFVILFSNGWRLLVDAADTSEEEIATFLLRDRNLLQLLRDGTLRGIGAL